MALRKPFYKLTSNEGVVAITYILDVFKDHHTNLLDIPNSVQTA